MTKSFSKADRALLLTIVCTFGASFLTGLVGILVSRVLGPEGRGIYATALVWGSLISFIVQLGLNQSIVYIAASDNTVRDVISGTLLIFLVQSMAAVIVAIFATPHFIWYPQLTRDAIRLYLLYVPPSLLLIYLTCACLGARATFRFNLMKIASALPPMLAVLSALLLGRSLLSILGWLLIWGYVIALIAFLLLNRQYKFFALHAVSNRTIGALLGYGLRSYWANICSFANMRIDQLILSFFVSAAALGNYSVAVSYSLLVFPLSSSIANLSFAAVAAADPKDKPKYMRDSVLKGTVGLAVSLLALSLLRRLLIPLLYGRGFEDAIALTPLLCLAALLLGVNNVLSDCLRGLNMPGVVSVAEGISTCITLVGLLLTVTRVGVWGAAWVSVVAYGFISVVLVTISTRVLKRPDRKSACLDGVIAGD